MLSLMIALRNLLLAIGAIAAVTGSAFAGANETPGTGRQPHRFGAYSPNLWEFGAPEIAKFQEIVVRSQHYTQGALHLDSALDYSPGGAGAFNFFTFCSNRKHDVMFVTSHGFDDPTTMVEAYPWDAVGLAIRNNMLAIYNSIFGPGMFVAFDWAGVGFDICATQLFYTTYFNSPRAFCYWSTCWSSLLSMPRRRDYLGYDNIVSVSKCECDGRIMLDRMDGREGQHKRPLGVAIADLNTLCPDVANLVHVGPGNTVLSPSVTHHEPDGVLCTGAPGRVKFDCTLDPAFPPSSVVRAFGDGYLTNHRWVGDDEIHFDVVPIRPNPTILYDVVESNTRSMADHARLDGNTRPRVNALGPNQDDYVWDTFCPGDPAAPLDSPPPVLLPAAPSPAQAASVLCSVVNHTADVQAVSLAFSDERGWGGPQLIEFELPPLSGETAYFDLTVPLGAPEGESDPFQIIITGPGEPIEHAGAVVVGGPLTAWIAGSPTVGAGYTNDVELILENNIGAEVVISGIELSDELGWNWVSATTEVEAGASSAVSVEFEVEVPDVPSGTRNELTLMALIEGQRVAVDLGTVEVGLAMNLRPWMPRLCPGDRDAAIRLEMENESPFELSGVTVEAFDVTGVLNGVVWEGPSDWPPESTQDGFLYLDIPADAALVGLDGALEVYVNASQGVTALLIPYHIEPAVVVSIGTTDRTPTFLTGWAEERPYELPITLTNFSDTDVDGTAFFDPCCDPFLSDLIPFSLGPNESIDLIQTVIILPDRPVGIGTSTVTLATEPGIGNGEAHFEYDVQSPVVADFGVKAIGGPEGAILELELTLQNQRDDRVMTGSLTWTDTRGWLTEPLVDLYELGRLESQTVPFQVAIPPLGAGDSAPLVGVETDSTEIAVIYEVTYDTGTVHYETATLRVGQVPAPSDVPDMEAGVANGIEQIWPSPSRQLAHIAFGLSRPGPVQLTLHDASGRKLTTILEGDLAAGSHRTIWDGRTSGREPAPSGIYFVRLTTRDGTTTRKVIHVK